MSLLAGTEPQAATVLRADGRSPVVLACDHASRRIPLALGSLGLTDAELGTHVAWDIGAAGVATRLANLLDAPLVLQEYSRLVIDCNRPPGAATSIPTLSERTGIPGNRDLPAAAIEARRQAIFDPYHAALARVLDDRERRAVPTVLVAVHSFTPVYLGVSRPWQTGLMYRHDRLAQPLLSALRSEPGLVVGDNQPYAITDTTDYTLPHHGERRGLAHVGIEIRQDLISADSAQREWAERLARLLPQAAALAGVV